MLLRHAGRGIRPSPQLLPVTWRAQQAPIRRLGFFDNIRKSVQETIDSDPELKKNVEELKKSKMMESMGGSADKVARFFFADVAFRLF
jgi:hypothetical protein